MGADPLYLEIKREKISHREENESIDSNIVLKIRKMTCRAALEIVPFTESHCAPFSKNKSEKKQCFFISKRKKIFSTS